MFSDKNDNLIGKFIGSAVNEPSIGLLYVQNHIKQSTPVILQLASNLNKNYEILIAAIPDIESTLAQAKMIKKLENEFIPNMKQFLETTNFALEKLKK